MILFFYNAEARRRKVFSIKLKKIIRYCLLLPHNTNEKGNLRGSVSSVYSIY